MKFETTAVVKEVGVIESFGANNFQKRNVILTEVNGQYENLVCVEFSGDKIELPNNYQVGQTVKVGGFINCREWEGRYFTGLSGSFIQSAGEAQQAPPQAGFGTQQAVQAQQQQVAVQQPMQQPIAQPQMQPVAQNMAPAPLNQVQQDIPY
jgi:hypothetical protein